MSETETEPVTEPDTEDVEPDEDEDEATEEEGEQEAGESAEAEALAPPAQTDKEIEKRMGQLDAEAKRHAKRVNEILGEDALGLVLCEACPQNTPGYHYPAQMFPEGSPERALYTQLAGDSGAPMVQPDFFVTCDQCNGHCNVLTGAAYGTMTYEIGCPKCKSAGYIDMRTQQGAPEMRTAPANGTVAEPVPVYEPQPDMWGRPPTADTYWKMPIGLTPEERAADLAAGYNIG